jgi:hypothetical protein
MLLVALGGRRAHGAKTQFRALGRNRQFVLGRVVEELAVILGQILSGRKNGRGAAEHGNMVAAGVRG